MVRDTCDDELTNCGFFTSYLEFSFSKVIKSKKETDLKTIQRNQFVALVSGTGRDSLMSQIPAIRTVCRIGISVIPES
jgi:hypothetical protein